MIMEMANSAGFLMGDDGRAQSKENKVFMANLAAVLGISMGAGYLGSGQCPRVEMAGGPAVTCHGLIQPGRGRKRRSEGLRDGTRQQESKKYGGNGSREAILVLLTQTQSSVCLCLPMNQRKLPPEPFAFQRLQLCFVSLRFKYSDWISAYYCENRRAIEKVKLHRGSSQ